MEKEESSAKYLNGLLSLHDECQLDVFVPAISGNEKLTNGVYSSSIKQFVNRLQKLSNRKIEILKPIMYLNLCFLDYCILSSDELEKLDKEIHRILFPRIPYEWKDYAKNNGLGINDLSPKWVNPRCDVISMWCHIYYKNDIFITSDKNFFRENKYDKLLALGAGKIMSPEKAYRFFQN